MPYGTVRVSRESLDLLRRMAREGRHSLREALSRAVEAYRRQRFIESVNAAYAGVRRNRKENARLNHELGGWETTLIDGLSDVSPRRRKPSRRRRGRS
jgi:hypothetical protein